MQKAPGEEEAEAEEEETEEEEEAAEEVEESAAAASAAADAGVAAREAVLIWLAAVLVAPPLLALLLLLLPWRWTWGRLPLELVVTIAAPPKATANIKTAPFALLAHRSAVRAPPLAASPALSAAATFPLLTGRRG